MLGSTGTRAQARKHAGHPGSQCIGIGSGPQFMAFGAGSANGGIPRTPNIAHFCMTVDKFELHRVLKTLADFGGKPRGNSARPVVPRTSYGSMRMEDPGGERDGNPEL